MSPENLRRSWNRIAGEQSTPRPCATDDISYGALAPPESALGLLGNVAGKRVLDLGCGDGRNCVALARMGALCTGVDLSDAQIQLAAAAVEQEGLDVHLSCSEMLEFLSSQPDDEFDIALSIFSLPYVSKLTDLFHHLHRVLRPEGLFIFATNHPLSDIVQMDSGAVVIHRSYFESAPEEWNWTTSRGIAVTPLVTFRRTVAELLNPLSAAGFCLEKLVEPEPLAENGADRDQMEVYSRVPAALICRARAVKA